MTTYKGRAVVPSRLGPIQIGRPWAVLTVEQRRIVLSHRFLPHVEIRQYSPRIVEYTAESGGDKGWLGLRQLGESAWTWFSAEGSQSALRAQLEAIGGRKRSSSWNVQPRPRRFTLATTVFAFPVGVIIYLIGSVFPGMVDQIVAPFRNPYQPYDTGVFIFHGFGVIAIALSVVNVVLVFVQDRRRRM